MPEPVLRGGRALAALAALLLTACGAGGAGAGEDTPDAVYDLVFDVTGSDGRSRLYRSDLSGRAPQPVAGGVIGTRATADPSGQALLFAANDPADPLSPPVLQWLDLVSGQQRQLSPDGTAVEAEPSVAPDGVHIAFTSQREDAAGDIVVARVANAALVERRNLTPDTPPTRGPDRTPAWSPDGRQIAFTAYRSGSPALWLMDREGGNPRRITSPGNEGDFSPSWSADGRLLAFQRVDAAPNAEGRLRTRIGLVAVDGGNPRWLTLPHNAYDPRFSPDGKSLAFWVKSDDGGDICVATAEGTVQQCFGTPGVDRHPAWVRRR